MFKNIAGKLSTRIIVSGHDQFSALSNNLNRMLEWISNLLESTKNTAISLAHDIKTPLSRHRITLEKMAENNEIGDGVKNDIFLFMRDFR